MPACDAPAAIHAPALVTFADLYADCGKPCCLCLKPLLPAEADHTGLAHRVCAERELADLEHEIAASDGYDLDAAPFVPTASEWEEYAAVMARFDAAAEPCEEVAF